jgi:Caspase domain
MGRLLVFAALILGLFLLRADAQTGQRVALVIGNGNYANAGTLANPVNDSQDVAAKLSALGFKVILGRDLAKRDLETKIGEFSDALEGAEAGLFFYAGHGLQVDGRNFIVPVDARLDVPAKLKLEAVPMDDILDIMEQQAKTSLVFLDACRNNPFARSLQRKATTRSALVGDGLAQFDSGRGSFIAFSTSPGAVAMDGSGRNSPFAAALLKHMDTPGQSINDLMISVRREVIKDTKDFQRPWEQGSLTERFEFVPAAAVAPAVPAINAPEPEVAAVPPEEQAKEEISQFILERYLKPDAARLEDIVRDNYTESVATYGRQVNSEELLALKVKWFAKWEKWRLDMLPGSLKVTVFDPETVRAEFDLRYRYTPKDKAFGPIAGTSHVFLDLVKIDGRWKIEMENAQ